MKNLLPPVFVLLMLLSCKPNTDKVALPARPVFHFTPPQHWINDPNGLVYYDGEYHLFYQHNPYGDTWGHMSWGHAVSTDLLQWEHLPVAIAEYPDAATGDSTMIFSGTVVVDTNTSGLCADSTCLVAVYTSHVHANGEGLRQHQSLAYSNDKGRTWTRYQNNPVLDIERKDFRDPKIFWYAPEKKWVMALVVPDLYTVQFYGSQNLLEWELTGKFGMAGDTTRIWECPDLYQLPVENEPGQHRWVLSLSGGHPQGPDFVGMQYFVGSFDGKRFVADEDFDAPQYVDHGKDFYAGIVFNNVPNQERVVMIGWVNNWTYANQIPTVGYRGAMSLPRELSLRREGDHYRLIQQPVHEVKRLRQESINIAKAQNGTPLEIKVTLDASTNGGVKVFEGNEHQTVIGFDADTRQLYVDRRNSGFNSFHKDFASREQAVVEPLNGNIELQIFLDYPVIEVFANNGSLVFTEYAFTSEAELKFSVFGGVVSSEAWRLGLPR